MYGDDSGVVQRSNRKLHLHRLEHDHGIALLHSCAGSRHELDDASGHGRGERLRGIADLVNCARLHRIWRILAKITAEDATVPEDPSIGGEPGHIQNLISSIV